MAPKIGYKAYVTALRAERRAAGKCIQCGRRKPAPGISRCAHCRGLLSATDAALRAARIAAGQCSRCGRAKATGKACRSCKAERIARAEARR